MKTGDVFGAYFSFVHIGTDRRRHCCRLIFRNARHRRFNSAGSASVLLADPSRLLARHCFKNSHCNRFVFYASDLAFRRLQSFQTRRCSLGQSGSDGFLRLFIFLCRRLHRFIFKCRLSLNYIRRCRFGRFN